MQKVDDANGTQMTRINFDLCITSCNICMLYNYKVEYYRSFWTRDLGMIESVTRVEHRSSPSASSRSY